MARAMMSRYAAKSARAAQLASRARGTHGDSIASARTTSPTGRARAMVRFCRKRGKRSSVMALTVEEGCRALATALVTSTTARIRGATTPAGIGMALSLGRCSA
jgi:hypothetical protein